MATKERQLTANQISFLKSARDFKGWAEKGPGAGWIWDSVSNTKRIAESLAARGYFAKEPTPYNGVERYVLTDKANSALAAAAEQQAENALRNLKNGTGHKP